MGTAQRVLSLLDELAGALAEPPTSASVGRLVLAASALHCAAYGDPATLVVELQIDRLSSKLAALGDAMAGMAAKLARPGGPHAAARMDPLNLTGLGASAASAIDTSMQLAATAGRMPSGEAARFAAGLTLTLTAGVPLLRRCIEQVKAACSQPGAEGRELLRDATACQLSAVQATLSWLTSQPDVAPAWLRGTGRPAAILPWLAVTAEALCLSTSAGDELDASICYHLATVCTLLLHPESPLAHAAALAAPPATQAALLGLLLGHVLPRVAALLEEVHGGSGSGSGEGSTGSPGGGDAGGGSAHVVLPGADGSPPEEMSAYLALTNLRTALIGADTPRHAGAAPGQLHRCMRQAGAAGLVRLAGRAARALPLRRADCPQPQLFVTAHVEAACLLTVLSTAAQEAAAGAGSQRERQPGGRAGSRAAPGRARTARDGGAGSAPSDSGAGRAEEQQAVLLAQLEVVPHTAAALRALEADSECGEGDLCRLAEALAQVLPARAAAEDDAGGAQRPPLTLEAAAAWAAALEAALAVLPLAVRHHAAWQRQGRAPAALLPTLVLPLLWTAGAEALRSMPHQSHPPASLPALARQLWRAHAAGCRAVHWWLQQPLHRAFDPSMSPSLLLLSIMRGLHALLMSADMTLMLTGRSAAEPALSALCAAHWAAVQAAQPVLAGSFGGVAECLDRAGLLLVSMVACDSAFTPPAEGPFFELLREMLEPASYQDSHAQQLAGVAVSGFVECCQLGRVPPRLAAALADAGLLGRLLQQDEVLAAAASQAAGGPAASPQPAQAEAADRIKLASTRLAVCWFVLTAVARAAQGLPEEHQQAAAELGAAMRGLPALSELQSGQAGHLASSIAAVSRATAPAQRVAALLLQHWARPEQVAADRLALAQAAAARSCANLRCANLGLEGGPAAGEGCGCKRCSACRAVFYCGTACSHADWRAGHRRVCAALGAARQAAAAGS